MPDIASIFGLAAANLTSPVVLFFALGLAASLVRSDLAVPEAFAKGIALYLIMAIGYKGGAAVAAEGADATMAATLICAALISAFMPVIAFPLLRRAAGLNVAEAAATAGHYGSISIVTFVAASQALETADIEAEGYMAAAAAIMEAPGILVAVWLYARARPKDEAGDGAVMREVLTNGSVVLLFGAFLVGLVTGERGLEAVSPFFVAPFLGVLCLFLLDMGLVAGRGLQEGLRSRAISWRLAAFGVYMPLIAAALAGATAYALGLSAGGAALLMTLAASASYIAAPAAMRLAVPDARPAVYLTASLGVTFTFNLTVGIPIYIAAANFITQ